MRNGDERKVRERKTGKTERKRKRGKEKRKSFEMFLEKDSTVSVQHC